MSGGRSGAVAGYLRFLATAILAAAAVGTIGWLPTVWLGGARAAQALLAGSAVALVASALGGVPVALAGPEAVKRPQAVLLAAAVRLVSVVALGLLAVESGRFAGRPLVVWTAISYGVQLALDSRYAMQAARRQQQ
jgi:hypothetical protein